MASRRIDTEGLSDEIIDLLCSVCKRKGKNNEAEKYCVDCNSYFCLSCLQVHDDFLSLAGHKVLDKEQFQTGTNQPVPLVPTERCERHGHKHVDMYCQDHDDVGCSTCIAVDHRSCRDTFYIPEFIQDKPRASSSREILVKLDVVAQGLYEQLENLKLEEQRLFAGRAKSLQEIKNFREKINEQLDKLEQNTIADVENRFKALINVIEEITRLLKASKATVTSAQDKLRTTDDNASQAFVSVKKGMKVAKEAQKRIDEGKKGIPAHDIQMVVDQKIYTALNEINVIGSLEQKDPLLKVKNKKTYSVKVASDKADCGIVSVCVLEDGRIVVSDYHNKKVKCVDSSTFTVQDYIDLPERPWQVCPINKQDVAVSLQYRREVQFISLQGKMMKKGQIKVDIDCFSLAYAVGCLYIASCTGGVYMYSASGRKLREFCKDESGHALFSNIYSLAVKDDGSRIFVADWYNGLIVLDYKGQAVWKYNGPELGNAYGCYLTKSGSVLVCGRSSNNVLQFGQDGKLIGEVLKSGRGVTGCQTACFNRSMSKMIISREQNELEVYDLC